MKENFYVTTPIYYVNDKPHIGHAYTTILADVLARCHRLLGSETYFLTGTDEHGEKVSRAAEKAGVTPQEQADRTVIRFKELWQRLEITNDDFIRTTEERHRLVVQKILQDLFDRGEIYKASYDGWYCVACERFYTEKDLDGDKCPEQGCGRPVEKIKESNYFFKMGKYRDWLVKYINDNPEFIQPDFRRNETLGFLKKDLNDLCISRPKSRLNWGIELPFDSEFVTYVWFDALVNYISAIKYMGDDGMFNMWWPAAHHLIGKDILTTHTVYWPTMLKAMNLPMPRTIFAHGWWLSGQEKMSKTKGNVVNPMDFAEKYGVDAFRYFLMAEMVPGQDSSFTEEIFVRRYNADLANDLGNVLSRIVKMIGNYFEGSMPSSSNEGEEEANLKEMTLGVVRAFQDSIKNFKPNQIIAGTGEVVRAINKYLESKQPWVMAKQGEMEQVGTVLYCSAEALRIVAGLLLPIMPGKIPELMEILGVGEGQISLAGLSEWGGLKPGSKVGEVKSLFPRIVMGKG